MGRISAAISGIELRLLDRIARADAAAALASLRQASGHRILSPAYNPSGFTALAQLRAEQSGVNSTLANVTAASTMVSQTQLALDQIRTQFNSIRTAASADHDLALSSAERTANQATIDAAIASINQLVSTTIGGRRMLDGSADFTLTGVNNIQIADISVLSLGPSASQTIAGTVTTPATRGQLTHTEGSGSLTADATIALAGSRGDESISLENGDTLSEAAAKINAQSDLTGVTATVVGNDLQLKSIGYGSQADVAVTVSSGTFAVTGGNGDGTAQGVDAQATINGQSLTGLGNAFSVNQNDLQFSITFAGGFSGVFDTVTASGDALRFALSTDLNQVSTLAIPGLQPSRLGGLSGKLTDLVSGGSLSGLGANAPMAVRVVDEALDQLTVIEGRVDGFANATIESSSALLEGMQTNLQIGIDAIDKVDPVEEADLIEQNQFLAANALAGLSILNQQRQNVLSLILQIANLSN